MKLEIVAVLGPAVRGAARPSRGASSHFCLGRRLAGRLGRRAARPSRSRCSRRSGPRSRRSRSIEVDRDESRGRRSARRRSRRAAAGGTPPAAAAPSDRFDLAEPSGGRRPASRRARRGLEAGRRAVRRMQEQGRARTARPSRASTSSSGQDHRRPRRAGPAPARASSDQATGSR